MLTIATNIAIIENNKVTNIIWGYPYNDRSSQIPIYDLGVQIGDIYDGRLFYHNGVQVKNNEDLQNDHINELLTEIESLCEEIIGE